MSAMAIGPTENEPPAEGDEVLDDGDLDALASGGSDWTVTFPSRGPVNLPTGPVGPWWGSSPDPSGAP